MGRQAPAGVRRRRRRHGVARRAGGIRAATAGDTRRLGAALGALLRAGDVVGLVGPLGSGKTTLAQGIARGLEVPRERHVASPTFTLVNEHPGRVPFVHADFYRVGRPDEIRELGLEESAARAACAVEWADRFPEALPSDRLDLRLEPRPDGARRIRLRATGPRGRALARAFRAAARRNHERR